MSDTTLNRFLSKGTTAQRTAFTPTPPTPASGPDPSYLWYDTDTDKLYAYDGGWVVAAGVAGTNLITTAVVAAGDESDSDNTVHDDAELLLAVATSSVYLLRAVLFFTTGTSTTPDVKVGFTLPASATMTMIVEGLTTAATSADTQWTFRAQYASSTPVTARATGVLSTATENCTPVIISGVVRTAGTSGNVVVQWAQSTTTGGTPTVRKADSFLQLIKVT